MEGQRTGGLDGIRGFAALSVLSAHVVVSLGLVSWSPLGSMGVLMFFALSGYLIAGVCLRLPPTLAGYRRFLRRRVVRLAPVNLALVLVGGPLLVLGGMAVGEVVRDSIGALTQTTAWVVAAGGEGNHPFSPTWSLTVEWVFYVLYPLLAFALTVRGWSAHRQSRLLAGLAIGLYLVGLTLTPLAFYLLPVANLGVMVAGAALRLWHEERAARPAEPARGFAALAILCIFVVLPGHGLGWGWKLSVLPATTVATLILIHQVVHQATVGRVMGLWWLRGVGLRAYSLYLWHMPVLWLTWRALGDHLRAPLVGIVAVVLVAAVTELSYLLLERPVLRGPRPMAAQGTTHPVAT